MIELAVVSDARFLEPIAVMLHSILRWHPAETLRLHWVHVRMDHQSRSAAKDVCRRAAITTHFVAADSILARAGLPANIHPTLLKVFLPEILDDIGTRLLYLDGDLIVEGPLWPLWQIDFGSGAVAGIRDSWIGAAGFWRWFPPLPGYRRDLWMRADYINAGVLIYDVSRCRGLDLARMCTRWLADHPDAPFLEQDALNAVLAGAIVLAPAAWNVLGPAETYLCPPQPHLPYSAAELLDAYRRPRVIHFAGLEKPWGAPSTWPLRAPSYVRARNRTPWHRLPTAVEKMHLAVLETVYRLQCRQRLWTARAILNARRVFLSTRARFEGLLRATGGAG